MISHPKIISKQQLRQQILICCFNCFANTKCGSDTVEVTVYLLDTSDSIYQNKRRNAKYSELFKCFCVKAATGHEIDDIAFKTGDYGKPLLYRPYNRHLNISHTDGFSVCIVSDMNVGIDIEKVEPIDLTIAKIILRRLNINTS